MRRSIEVLLSSITDTGADAVVNASNPDAVLGGGVSRALFDECGGAVLQDEMKGRSPSRSRCSAQARGS